MAKTKKTPVKALLLDAGNTVVFLDHDVVAQISGLDAARLRDAEVLAKEQYASLLADGGSHEDGWRMFMRTLLSIASGENHPDGPDPSDWTLIVDALRAEHDIFNLWRRVPEGLIDALSRAVAAGWTPAIVSNSEGRLPELFERVGLDDTFEVIVDSANVGVRKPDPEIFQIALQALGAKAENAVYLGDIPGVDITGAWGAGISAALVDPSGAYEGKVVDTIPRYQSVVQFIDVLISQGV